MSLLTPKTMRAREISRLALTVTEAAEAIGVSPDFFAEHVFADHAD